MNGYKQLRTTLCIPGRNYPSAEKEIIAKVSDGITTRFFTFGPDVTKKRIMEMMPMVWQDFHFDERRKKRGKAV